MLFYATAASAPLSLLCWAWYNKKGRMKNFTFSVDWFVCNINVKLAGLVSMNNLKQQSNFTQDRNLGHNFFHAKHQQYVSTYAKKLQGVRVWGGECFFPLQISWIRVFRVSLLFLLRPVPVFEIYMHESKPWWQSISIRTAYNVLQSCLCNGGMINTILCYSIQTKLDT